MNRIHITRWTVAAVLSTAASFALAQGAGGDSTGGNADPKVPAAGASGPHTTHGTKKEMRKPKKDKASGAGNGASVPAAAPALPSDTPGGKSTTGGGPR